MAAKKSNAGDVQRFKRTDWSKEVSAQDDPIRNPVGLLSGMAKRVAIEDGTYEGVTNYPRSKK